MKNKFKLSILLLLVTIGAVFSIQSCSESEADDLTKSTPTSDLDDAKLVNSTDTLTPDYDHMITFGNGDSMARAWREANTSADYAYTYGIDDIKTLVNATNAEYLSIFHAIDRGENTLVLICRDADGNFLESVVAEHGYQCPGPMCPYYEHNHGNAPMPPKKNGGFY